MINRIADRIEAIVISVFSYLVSFNLEETRLRHQNEMQFAAVSYEIQIFWWFCIPVPFVTERVERGVEINAEINLLSSTTQYSQFMPSDLSEDTVAFIEESLSDEVDEAISREVHSLESHIQQSKENLNHSVLSLTDQSFQHLVSEVANKLLDRYKQGLLTQLEDAIRDADLRAVSEFRNTVRDIKGGESGPRLTKPKCRMEYTLENGKQVVVIEEPPQVRSILFSRSVIQNHSGSYSGKSRYRLAFPYVIFVQSWVGDRNGKFYVFFSDSPLRSLDEELCPANLPNVDTNGKMCTGGWTGNYDPDSHLQEKAYQLVSGFWNSRFNSDLTRHLVNAASRNAVLSSFESWERASEDGPEFMLDLNWWSSDHHTSVNQIIENREAETGHNDPVQSAIGGFIDDLRSEIATGFRDRFDRIDSVDDSEIPFSLEMELKNGLRSVVDTIVDGVTSELTQYESDLVNIEDSEHGLRRMIANEITENLDTSVRVVPEDDAQYLSNQH